jgi:hypothetical protein
LPTPASPSRNSGRFRRTPQEQRDREATVGDIVLVGEALLEIGNGAGKE